MQRISDNILGGPQGNQAEEAGTNRINNIILIVLSTYAFGCGSLYFMLTIKGAQHDNVESMVDNFYHMKIPIAGGAMGETFTVRYVKHGTPQKEEGDDYVKNFILPS